jgi:hypothetical protein
MDETSSAATTTFAPTLSRALSIAIAVAVGSWILQFIVRFPPRSRGAGVTALGLVLGSTAALIAVAVAIVFLIRHPASRTWRNVLLTVVGVLASLPALVVGVSFLLE